MQKIIVLLGASNDAEGRLSRMALDRLECAYALYAHNRDARFLCTGGFGEHFNETETPHAEYLKRWLCDKGVEADRFLPHVLSANTYEDIQKLDEAARSLTTNLLIVVTSDFHVERVRLLCELFVRHESMLFVPAKSHLEEQEFLSRREHEAKAIRFLKSKYDSDTH